MSDGLPPGAVNAGYAAWQKAWATRNQSDPLFAENVTRAVLEAAAPLIRAAERERIRQLAIERQARYRACEAADHSAMINPGDCKAWHHRRPFADLLREQP